MSSVYEVLSMIRVVPPLPDLREFADNEAAPEIGSKSPNRLADESTRSHSGLHWRGARELHIPWQIAALFGLIKRRNWI